MNYQKELKIATKLVRNASQITSWFKERSFRELRKQDKTPVTLADWASQIYIISQLKESFSNDQIIAEEDSSVLISTLSSNIRKCYLDLNVTIESNLKSILNYRGSKSQRKWTIDPVAGTRGFCLPNGIYCIAIGFMIENDPKVCAIHIPNYKDGTPATFRAIKNAGAYASYKGGEFQKIHVSSRSKLDSARMCQSKHNSAPEIYKFADMVGISDKLVIDSMAKYCKIAEGSYDFYLRQSNFYNGSWDFVPGNLLVQEAGGNMTDLKNNSLQFHEECCILSAPGFLASNDMLHDRILEIYNDNFL
ncbi:MAG: inositol monophosphatase family protein [Promethearchaeia archaeon]